MSRVSRVSGCAVLSIAAILLPTIVIAQVDNPFGPAEDEGFTQPQVAPDGLEPEPALAPTPAIDPSPGGEIALPAVADAPASEPNEFCRCVGEGSSAQSLVHIRAALRSPLRDNGLVVEDLELQKVVAILQDQYDIPIHLDTAALDDLGVQPDQPITVNLRSISLRSALRLMLKDLGLTYIIADEVLLITTPDEAEQQLKVCVYDVRDLIDRSNTADMNALRDTILSCVATETWAKNGGGEAEIKSLRSGLLVVSQTQAVHEELRDTLEAIRAQQSAQPRAAAAAPALQGITAATNDDSKVVTRSYYLQINQQPGGESFAPKVRELITLSLPDEQWDGRLGNGEPVVLTVLPDRVVLRHRQSVQNKVQSLLTDSGLSSSPTPVAGETGGGGGFFSPQPAEHQ